MKKTFTVDGFEIVVESQFKRHHYDIKAEIVKPITVGRLDFMVAEMHEEWLEQRANMYSDPIFGSTNRTTEIRREFGKRYSDEARNRLFDALKSAIDQFTSNPEWRTITDAEHVQNMISEIDSEISRLNLRREEWVKKGGLHAS